MLNLSVVNKDSLFVSLSFHQDSLQGLHLYLKNLVSLPQSLILGAYDFVINIPALFSAQYQRFVLTEL
jgi:hypothetical protein